MFHLIRPERVHSARADEEVGALARHERGGRLALPAADENSDCPASLAANDEVGRPAPLAADETTLSTIDWQSQQDTTFCLVYLYVKGDFRSLL